MCRETKEHHSTNEKKLALSCPIQWVPGAVSLGVKRPGREADHSPSSRVKVKECVELNLHYPNTLSLRGAQLKHRDNLIFTFLIVSNASQHIHFHLFRVCKSTFSFPFFDFVLCCPLFVFIFYHAHCICDLKYNVTKRIHWLFYVNIHIEWNILRVPGVLTCDWNNCGSFLCLSLLIFLSGTNGLLLYV
jgi:hypothetical protein